MKQFLVVVLMVMVFVVNATNPLLKKQPENVWFQNTKLPVKNNLLPVFKPAYFIPPYKTPKGSVFCRMEEKVTKASGVWLKLGVGTK